jgi:hypothetical protein
MLHSFRKAIVDQLSIIERPTAEHLYWPLLDVDLSKVSARDPSALALALI